MEENNNKKYFFIIGIIIVLFLGYIVYGEVTGKSLFSKIFNNNTVELKGDDNKNDDNKDDDNENNSSELENKTSLSKAKAKEIINKYLTMDIYNLMTNLKSRGLVEELKLSAAISLTKSTNEYNCYSLFNNTYPIKTNQWTCPLKGDTYSYKYDDVSKQYKALFGSTQSAPKIDVFQPFAFAYNENNNIFVKLEPQFTPGYKENVYYVVDSITEDSNKTIVKITYLAYYDSRDSKYVYQYDLNGQTYGVSNEASIKNDFESKKSNLNQLTLEFNKENNTYLLSRAY